MLRLWCWIKKLKWPGYGHNKQDPLHPPAGSLANYCPTCPQPGINLPADWIKIGLSDLYIGIILTTFLNGIKLRFVYWVVLVADRNFKADHVRQTSDGDVWLMDGAGMFPNHEEYFTFLASAIERFTVCTAFGIAGANTDAILTEISCLL